MKRIALLIVGMVLGLMLAVPALAADYDLVILNGRVIDPETNFDGIRNVGIKGGKTAGITRTRSRARKPSTPPALRWPPVLSTDSNIARSPMPIA